MTAVPAVAFQGETGAYSETALKQLFDGRVVTVPCRGVGDAITALRQGTAGHALLPVENSYAGTIGETLDSIVCHESLTVTGETCLRIEHCLLALPGQTLDTIRAVHSHPQALAQCDQFLERLGVECVPEYDTAGSARMLAERKMTGCAAIAGPNLASSHGLEVLARNIQTLPDNLTRFWLVSMGPAAPRRTERPHRTLLVVRLPHQPGALQACLSPLARHNVNLTWLATRPWRGRQWEYVFFLELAGKPDTPPVQQALADMMSSDVCCRVIGSFPDGRQ